MKTQIVRLTTLLLILACTNQLFAQEAHRRWRMLNQIRQDKFDLILPEVMKENQIDMWIVTGREGRYDPLWTDLGEGFIGKNAYYVFYDNGGDRVERIVLGNNNYLNRMGNVYDHFGSTDELAEIVNSRNPKKIGLNYSKNFGGADGLSYSEWLELGEILGEKYKKRFVSAEKLVSDFRSRRVATEIAAFAEACDYSYRIAEEAFSNKVITPGVTTLEDVAWWMREQQFKYNLGSSFGMPSVYVTGPEGILATSSDRIIQRGDVLMLDWGVGLMNFFTDMKRMAYVLKEGETEVPQSIQKAFAEAMKVRSIIKANIKAGVTAKTAETNVFNALEKAGFNNVEFNQPTDDPSIIDVVVGCHSVGNWGHGIGPSVAFFNPVRLGYMLHPTNLLSIEFFTFTALPEWNNKKLRIPIEDDAILTARGIEWLYPVNPRVLVIK